MVIRGATGSKCYRLPPSEKENSEVRDKKLIPLSSLKTLVHVNVKGLGIHGTFSVIFC